MTGFLVPRSIVRCPIDFHEKKTCGVISLLDEVETGNPRLLEAASGVLNARQLEFFDLVGFNMNEDMNDMHEGILLCCIR